ncbi:protein sprouty homolog 2 [Cottoperca gobio]|uniref:Protein sprouty homolog 2 n=1 Tax=Cottoperca gobio TaxID=56716 RepID=A0A6J2QYU8_COTGO|nr:protein sprouty homolog 2-like [Cottoperca gobio]XP_029302361.1 protein sprouty homolog 2-like [Cottoperca gobio]XP_029302370.1 protein sprouty homolog 2-like [Cottoperca gobio]XP_029302376.1 protein sprouty homolog 2-like [Cottoperca gobio]
MDSTSQNDSDGGGGRQGRSPSSTGSPGTPHDEGRPQPRPPQTHDGSPDPGLTNRQLLHTPAVLSLDQIRITGSSNEYTDGPTVAQRSPASQQRQQKSDLVTTPGSRTSEQQETREEGPNNLRNLHSLTQYGNTNASIPSREGELRSSSADSQSSIRTSVGSTSSGQRVFSSPACSNQIIRTQPKRAKLNSEELKPLSVESRAVLAVPGSGSYKNQGIHSNKCEDCGRCCCPECSRPRVLPSCWMCGRRCMCSVQSAVEYGTCVCCVKGLFYHCSSDDEDTCTDKPFSCTQSHCCVRWATVSLFSLLFPCLLCYLPAKGCVAVCQCCYDQVTRPGCRCKNTNPIHCEDVDKPT